MNKVTYNKIFTFIVLLIIFIFLLNTNISFARKISFDLHDGSVSTLEQDDEEDNNDGDNDDNDNNDDNEDNDDNDNNEDNNDGETDGDDNLEEGQIVKNGAYIISCAESPNYVLDIYHNSLDWGGNLQICTYNGGSNQKFYITYEGDGYYKIAVIGSALALDVKDGVEDNSANIQQWEDNGADAQRFKIIENDDGTYNFIAKCSGKALDVNGGIYEEGTNIQQWDYINSDAQKFKLKETEFINDNEIVSIKRASNYKYALDIDNSSAVDGTAIQLYEVTDTFAQRFEIERIAKNEIRIRTVSSGGWLTEAGTSNGSKIVQKGNSKTPVEDASTWILEWDNGILLRNKESNLYIDVDSNVSENKRKVQVHERNASSSSQTFLINREHLIKDGWYEITSPLGVNVDLDNGGSDWGVNILAWQRNDQNNQKFRFSYTDTGYKISTIFDLPIEVVDGKTTNGANVQQWDDNGALCQRWKVEILDGGYVKLKNANSGKYLDIEGSATNGANIYQYEGTDSDSQKWKIVSTGIVSGWFKINGDMYCADPATGQLVKNCTRVDPTMTDPSQFGSIYDFDANGRATWHLPTFEDLPGGHGKTAPIPSPVGDERQRTLLYALSRVGCDYKLFEAPTGFVCDGLIAWSFTNATGKRFRQNTAIDDQDMSYQYEYIKNRNGIQTDISNAKPGDIIFWGDPAYIENHSTSGSRHVSMYYYGDYMIHAADVSHGVCIGNFSVDQNTFKDFIGFGSPYTETSKCEIPNIF